MSVVWPLRYPLTGSLTLRSATAQVLTRIADETGELVVLSATDGVPVELVLDGDVAVGGAGTARRDGATTVVTLDVPPGPETVVDLPGVRVLVLDEATANRLYRLDVGGRERLVLSDVPVYALDGRLVAHPDTASWSVSLFPAPTTSPAVRARAEPGTVSSRARTRCGAPGP